MKLKKLNKALMAAGLVAGVSVATPSQAVVMSDDGTGEVLIYPLYTVQGPTTAPRTTLMTIVNHSATEYKAVKVRFHEAHNSRDALDFNLYLSPGDVWTGSVSRDPATGIASLNTSDKSCTLPKEVMTQTFTFSTAAFTQASFNDGGNQDPLRTNEGYVEVIEMGTIDPDAPLMTDGLFPAGVAGIATTLDTFGEAIKHTNGIPGGVMSGDYPIGCLALEQAVIDTSGAQQGTWRIAGAANLLGAGGVAGNALANAHVGVHEPTGSLSGTSLIVQGTIGTVMGADATALKHFYDVAKNNVAEFVGEAGLNAACAGVVTDHVAGTLCETYDSAGIAGTTTARSYDDIHSFKDLQTATANPRSVQTYPNLAQAFPQISTHYTDDANGGYTSILEWANTELVSSGITTGSANVLRASAQDLNTVVDVLSCGGNNSGVASTVSDAGVCSNARPVSAVLMREHILNEYVLEQSAGIDFRTDIVVTMPTKWYFTDNGLYISATDADSMDETSLVVAASTDAAAANGGAGLNEYGNQATFTGNADEDGGLAPFTSEFVETDFAGTDDAGRDKACEWFDFSVTNREEGVVASSSSLVPSPAITTLPNINFFCQEANVVTLNDGDLMSSRIANGLTATVANSANTQNSFSVSTDPFLSGHFAMDLTAEAGHAMTAFAAGAGAMAATHSGPGDAFSAANAIAGFTNGSAATLNGLPVVGYSVEGLINPDPAQFAGNFTALFNHKYIMTRP